MSKCAPEGKIKKDHKPLEKASDMKAKRSFEGYKELQRKTGEAGKK